MHPPLSLHKQQKQKAYIQFQSYVTYNSWHLGENKLMFGRNIYPYKEMENQISFIEVTCIQQSAHLK